MLISVVEQANCVKLSTNLAPLLVVSQFLLDFQNIVSLQLYIHKTRVDWSENRYFLLTPNVWTWGMDIMWIVQPAKNIFAENLVGIFAMCMTLSDEE